jgi:hypothetical protein
MTNDGQRSDPLRFQIENEMDLLLGRAHPNPTREGCPPRDLLVSLSRRELPIGDPAYDHLSKCSPCYQELRALQQADAAALKAAVRRKRLAYAAAAVLVLAIGASWVVLRQAGSPADTAQSASAVEQNARLDLRPYAITRGEQQPGDRPPLVLPRGRVLLTLLLPTGSEPGLYEVEIRDSSAVLQASARGDADLRNQITTLEVTVDLVSLSPDGYQLAIRRSGEDWQIFPTQVR